MPIERQGKEKEKNMSGTLGASQRMRFLTLGKKILTPPGLSVRGRCWCSSRPERSLCNVKKDVHGMSGGEKVVDNSTVAVFGAPPALRMIKPVQI